MGPCRGVAVNTQATVELRATLIHRFSSYFLTIASPGSPLLVTWWRRRGTRAVGCAPGWAPNESALTVTHKREENHGVRLTTHCQFIRQGTRGGPKRCPLDPGGPSNSSRRAPLFLREALYLIQLGARFLDSRHCLWNVCVLPVQRPGVPVVGGCLTAAWSARN